MFKPFLTMLLSSGIFAVQAATLTFGPPVDKTVITPVAEVIAAPQQYLDSTITITGQIQAVCQKRGCWMTLATTVDEPTFRIKVRDGDMEFPLSAKGKTAYASGAVTAQTLNMNATIDYLEERAEQRGETFDPASVTEPLTFYQFVPVSVEIAE